MRSGSLVAALLLAPAAGAATIDQADFRYTRGLQATGNGYVGFVPDGPLFAHSRAGLADLRILDAEGRQTPWRFFPEMDAERVRRVRFLNSGREGRAFVALADLGSRRIVRNRLELDLDERDFVARVTVFGSNGRFPTTRLSTTTVYDVRGASAARSTTLVFPPNAYRYLFLRAVGLRSPMTGGRVFNEPAPPAVEPVAARVRRRERSGSTVVQLDVRFPKLPVDFLRFSTSTARFDREVRVEGSNGIGFAPVLGVGRIVRLGGVSQVRVPIDARHRHLRITISNGDDAPLADLRVQPQAKARRIVLDRGFQPPFRLLYGNSGLESPAYDFQQVARRELRPVRIGRLGVEQANRAFEPPEDTRSFVERHDWLVEAALAFGAAVIGVGGFFALRRRA